MIIIVLTKGYPFDRPLNIKMMLVGRLRLSIYNKDKFRDFSFPKSFQSKYTCSDLQN